MFGNIHCTWLKVFTCELCAQAAARQLADIEVAHMDVEAQHTGKLHLLQLPAGRQLLYNERTAEALTLDYVDGGWTLEMTPAGYGHLVSTDRSVFAPDVFKTSLHSCARQGFGSLQSYVYNKTGASSE